MTKKRIIKNFPSQSEKTILTQDVYKIEIMINKFDQKSGQEFDHIHIRVLLGNHFSTRTSPVMPVYVKPITEIRKRTEDAEIREIVGLQIAEKNQNPAYASNILANIAIETYPSHLVVLIVPSESELQNWEKVRTAAKAIINKLQEVNFEIESVMPKDLLPQSLLHAWDQIPEHYSDRTILELWWRGRTYKEIGQAVDKSADTVGNILSDLRKTYHSDIVPTDKQRKARIRQKVSDMP